MIDSRFPFSRVQWITSSFLIGTVVIAVTGVPAYIWFHGIDAFQVVLFNFYFWATGLSITLGYHRLFAHLSFKASRPVRIFVLLFGAAAFQNSVYDWVSDHRRHHKYVDADDDPYDISKGFLFAHIGWLLFKLKPKPPQDNVADLNRDPLVMWQHRWVQVIAVSVGLVLPCLIGFLYGGFVAALGAFLIAGVARTVVVQQMTFFINSFCHTIGKRPYSSKCSARDSNFMALFTFGEGYHNFHHEFQHDFRNGVKFWQWDPTKWMILFLKRIGLADNLRRAPAEKILMAEMSEARRQIDASLKAWSGRIVDSYPEALHSVLDGLHETSHRLAAEYKELQDTVRQRIETSRDRIKAWRLEIRLALEELESLSKFDALYQTA